MPNAWAVSAEVTAMCASSSGVGETLTAQSPYTRICGVQKVRAHILTYTNEHVYATQGRIVL